jgi:hypothetical protein
LEAPVFPPAPDIHAKHFTHGAEYKGFI